MEQRTSTGHMLLSAIWMLAAVAFVVYTWAIIGPTHPLFGVLTTVFLFGAAGFTGPVAERLIPRRWMLVSTSTQRALQRVGTDRFGRLLAQLGWQVRAKLVSRLQLDELMMQVHRSFSAHMLAGGFQLVLGLIVLVLGGVVSGITLVVLSLPLHVYPVLLQIRLYERFVRLRNLIAEEPDSPS